MGIEAIGAASIAMNLGSVQQSASISMAKKTMDSQEAQMTQLIQDLQDANPISNNLLDVTV